MKIDADKVSAREIYMRMISLISPRPIAWVSSVSAGGVSNLAPFSFFSGVGANPPSLVFSVVNRRDGSKKDTLLNIEATGEFVVNVVSFRLAERMNQTSAEFPASESEFERCGLTKILAERVKAPRVQEAAAHMECMRDRIVPVGKGPLAAHLIIGRILLMHVDDAVLNEAGEVDPEKLDTIGRMGGACYARTCVRFNMERPPRPL